MEPARMQQASPAWSIGLWACSRLLLGTLGLDSWFSYHTGFRAEKVQMVTPVSSAKPQPLLEQVRVAENLPELQGGGRWGLLVSAWAPEADAK